jgi:hypothetical protein
MDKWQFPFDMLQEIVETAGLWLVPADERSEGESDSVVLRPEYSGRGYASGFGIVLEGSLAIHRFMAAAGQVNAWHDEHGGEQIDIDSFARTTEWDTMGRSRTIYYWRNWEVTGIPAEFKRD